MSVLVDTSVWVDHFRYRNAALVDLLERDQAMSHPMVVVELACETPPTSRVQTLNNIELLRPCQQANLQEVREFIERHELFGRGCGLVDMALQASTLIMPGGSSLDTHFTVSDIHPAIDIQRLPIEVGGIVGGQEGYHTGHRLRQAAALLGTRASSLSRTLSGIWAVISDSMKPGARHHGHAFV